MTRAISSETSDKPSRRAFLGDALKLGAGSLLLGSSVRQSAAVDGSTQASRGSALRTGVSLPAELPEFPTRVFVEHDGMVLKPMTREGKSFVSEGARVQVVPVASGQSIRVTCPAGPISRVVLRWELTFP